jgi:hypothetical protein
MLKKLFFLLGFCTSSLVSLAANYTLSGTISDAKSGEALYGVSVYVKNANTGTASNSYGFYSLTLPEGTYGITVAAMGYASQTFTIQLDRNIEKKIVLEVEAAQIKEVVVKADRDDIKNEVKSTRMSQIKLDMEQVKRLPSLGGEVDIIKVMMLLPGVKQGGEGQTGMYVRGGAADQNLILLDEATVYNVSHLFGFFSVFNNDAIKDVTLIKGGFPAQYGGRVSSILDIKMKEGNMTKYSAEGGIGLLSSRATIQGPVIKEKMSFLISGRRSYIDQLLKVFGVPLPYYFYDLNGKLNYKISDRDRLFYSAYFGNDVLHEPDFESSNDSGTVDLNADFGFALGNFTNTLRWNHIYNPKMFSNASLVYTRFRYDISGKFLDNSLYIASKVRDIGLKLDYDYYLNPLNHIKFGFQGTNHFFRPNVISTAGQISQALKSKEGKLLYSQELALYGANEQILSEKLTINYGFRMSGLNTDGKVYLGPEPRFAATYALSDKNSFKFGLSRMYQYMHLVSSSSIALPTDLWYPVTRRVKPQVSDQAAVGYTRYIGAISSLMTIEAYYKRMNNLIEYKEGAVLILNDNYEDELLTGKGRAYGFEFFINKTKGRFNGWVGYSLSWADRQFDGLNKGKRFYAKYDRRHDVSVVANFDASKRLTISAVWVYATGQRLTARIGNYLMPTPSYDDVTIIPIYSGKNEFRFDPSHRLDLNFAIKRKPERKRQGEWNFGAYNVYNQTQPYKVDIQPDPATGEFKYMQKGLFGLMPYVAYNFKF